MKRLLPKTLKNPQGFTLIELLVVIAIIAVLAVMGFAAFGGLISKGNDDRRRVDIKAISDALEVAKGNADKYQPITVNNFAGGIMPKEPDTATTRYAKYCYKDGTAAISNPAAWASGACPDATWTDLNAATGITPAATATFFKVCTLLGDNTSVICQGSRQ